MYQRLAMAVPTISDPEHEGHEVADHLIRHEEEDGGEARHDEHHQGGDHGLAPGRPRDLLGLGADLLQKLERTDLRHSFLPCPRTRARRTAPTIGPVRPFRRYIYA